MKSLCEYLYTTHLSKCKLQYPELVTDSGSIRKYQALTTSEITAILSDVGETCRDIVILLNLNMIDFFRNE